MTGKFDEGKYCRVEKLNYLLFDILYLNDNWYLKGCSASFTI